VKTDQEVIDTMDDFEMLSRPHLWPGPDGIVFMKRDRWTGDDDRDLGFVHPSQPLTVYGGNAFQEPDKPRPKYQYDSILDILAAGWHVD